MDDSDQNETGSRPSTRFRWNYGSKEGREAFGLETTINGDPTDAALGGDIASVIKALGSCSAAAVALANHNRDTAESGAITTCHVDCIVRSDRALSLDTRAHGKAYPRIAGKYARTIRDRVSDSSREDDDTA